MTISTTYALKQYRAKLKDWMKHKGPDGGGGPYNVDQHKYTPHPEPKPDEFELKDVFQRKAAAVIRAEELAEYRLKNPEPEKKP